MQPSGEDCNGLIKRERKFVLDLNNSQIFGRITRPIVAGVPAHEDAHKRQSSELLTDFVKLYEMRTSWTLYQGIEFSTAFALLIYLIIFALIEALIVKLYQVTRNSKSSHDEFPKK